MNRLTEIIETPNGRLSSMRIMMLVWLGGSFAVWAWVSYVKGELVALPESIITMSGIVTGGKVAQTYGEKKTTTETKTES